MHPEDTEPDEGATAVNPYNRIDYEQYPIYGVLLWAYQPQLRHRHALCII